jgi:hypothetical protein
MLLCACGSLSNEDVAFLVAVPQKGSLHVQVPQAGVGQTACLIGTADVWLSAKTTGNQLNSFIDDILGLVDFIRAVPPTNRDADSRTWGPWPDAKHPGVQFRFVIVRLLDAGGVPWSWEWVLEGRLGGGAFLPVFSGVFYGAQAVKGTGKLVIHFDNAAALGLNDDPNLKFPAWIYYDLSSDPRTLSFDLSSKPLGQGLLAFDYFYAGYADGHGRFDYAFPTDNGCIVEVTTKYTADGIGRGHIHLTCGILRGDVDQCWDQSACLTYVNDAFEFTPACKGIRPCTLGNPARCPAVP